MTRTAYHGLAEFERLVQRGIAIGQLRADAPAEVGVGLHVGHLPPGQSHVEADFIEELVDALTDGPETRFGDRLLSGCQECTEAVAVEAGVQGTVSSARGHPWTFAAFDPGGTTVQIRIGANSMVQRYS